MRHTPDTPLVGNLDQEMPGVAWDLFPMDRYRAHNWHCMDGLQRQPYAALYSTLGCPYHCTFCCIQAPFKSGEKAGGVRESTNSYRYWSPDAVIAQIDVLVNKYGVRNIKIADEMFVLNKKHVMGICDKIIERGYDLNIWAYTRVDTIKEGMLDKLKTAGFNWLAFGIEAGADRVRDNVDKSFGQDEVRDVISSVRNAGINVIANYIFGLPEDDHETMRSTSGSRARSQLRVRQLLFRDGLPRLAALYDGGAPRCAFAKTLDRLLATLQRLHADANLLHYRSGSVSLPRSRVPRIPHASEIPGDGANQVRPGDGSPHGADGKPSPGARSTLRQVRSAR